MKEQKKSGRRKGKISFDEEVVNKDYARKLISEDVNTSLNSKHTEEKQFESKQTRKKKRTKEDSEKSRHESSEMRKDTKKQKLNNINVKSNTEDSEGSPNAPKKESIRAIKRQKHAKLMEEKKIKIELDLQQKALNYLSKWKHSKSEWKFEKLKQVWLQQNLFHASKIPEEFWQVTLEYFKGAKGHSRQAVLDAAIKYVEDEEKCSAEEMDEDYQHKLKRARDIVQNLE